MSSISQPFRKEIDIKFGYLPVFRISASSRVFKIVAGMLSALGNPETKNAKVTQQQYKQQLNRPLSASELPHMDWLLLIAGLKGRTWFPL